MDHLHYNGSFTFRSIKNWYVKYQNICEWKFKQLNHQLAVNCHKLKRENFMWKRYSSNGIIHIVQILGNKPIKVFHQSKLDELFPEFNFHGQCGEAPKVAHESVWVIFNLPLKIVNACVGFCSCVCFLLLFIFNDRFFSR